MVNKVDIWLDEHKEDFIEDLKKLVAVKSVKTDALPGKPFGEGSAEVMELACEMLKGYGFSAVNLDNYIAYADINNGIDALDILGHLDVVGEGDGWDTEPYVATVKDDGCIYGRGTSDDKGPVLAALYAMRAIKECGIELSKNARLIIGADEESGSELDLEHYYSKFSPAPATFSPDASFPICNTEKGNYKPTFTKNWEKTTAMPRVSHFDGGFRINVLPANAQADLIGIDAQTVKEKIGNIAEKYGVECIVTEKDGMVNIKVTGAGAHASTPEEGINGITALLSILDSLKLVDCGSTRAIHELTSFFPFNDNYGKALGINLCDEISGPLTVAFSLLKIDESGMWGRFDSRIPICANDNNLRVPVENIFKKHGYEIEGELTAPHHTPSDTDFIKTLSNAYELYTSNKAECLYMGGGTYVHNIKGGVAFGAEMPGFQSNMHGANERSNINDLITSTKIFAKVIIDMCK